MARRLMLLIPIGIGAILLVSFIGGQSVTLLWNWLLPPLFGFPQITFWQGLAMLALCRILFGGLRLGGDNDGKRYRRRWDAMTPEERERVRERIRARHGGRWGGFGAPTGSPGH